MPLIRSRCRGYVVFVHILLLVICLGSTVSKASASFFTPPSLYSEELVPMESQTGEITGPASICIPSNAISYSITAVAGATDYIWVVPTGATITSGQGTTTIVVDFSGSSVSDSIKVDVVGSSPAHYSSFVTVYNRPVPTISGSTTPCRGDATSLFTYTYTTEAGMSNYIWTVSSGYIITAGGGSSNNSITVKWRSSSTKTITVSYTDPNGCTPVSPTALIINPIGPTVFGPTSSCSGDTKTYSTEVGKSGYLWTASFGGTVTSGQGTSTANVKWSSASASPRKISVKYTDGACTTSDTLNVLVYYIASTITVIGAASPCPNTTVQYSAETGQSGYVWSLWSGKGTIVSGQGTNIITVLWNSTGSDSVRVTYNNGSGGMCAFKPGAKFVSIKSAPSPTISGSSNCCINTSQTYTTESGVTNYIWIVSSGGTITSGGGAAQNFVTVTWISGGNQTVKVSYTGTNGCATITPSIKNITVNPLPVPTITGPATACLNVPGQIYTTESSMTGYSWSITGGVIIGSSTTNQVNVTWNSLGTQSLSVTYSSNGCAAATPTNKSVTVNALPVPTIVSGPTSVCLNSTGNTYTTQSGKTSYNWSISSGGSITAGGGSSDDFVTVAWNSVGSKTVSVNYLDANGCTAVVPASYAVTVNGLPTPTISGPNLVCGLPSLGNHYTTEAGKTGYTWSVSSGGIITSGFNSNEIEVTWNSEGTKTVTGTYTDENGCISPTPTSYTVTVGSNPIPTLTGPTSPCSGETGNVYVTNGGKSNYIWSVTEHGLVTAGGGVNDSTITITWVSIGDDTVSVSYTDSSGCSALSPTMRVVYTRPPVSEVQFTLGETSLCQDSPDELYTAQATNSTSISYSVTPASAGLINSISGVMNWNADFSGVAHITATAAGCLGPKSATLDVTIHPKPTPSAIGHY